MAIYNIDYLNESFNNDGNDNSDLLEARIYDTRLDILLYMNEISYMYKLNSGTITEGVVYDKIRDASKKLIEKIKKFFTDLKNWFLKTVQKLKIKFVKKKIQDEIKRENNQQEKSDTNKIEDQNDIKNITFNYIDYNLSRIDSFIADLRSPDDDFLEMMENNKDKFREYIKTMFSVSPGKREHILGSRHNAFIYDTKLENPTLNDFEKLILDIEDKANKSIKYLDNSKNDTVKRVNRDFERNMKYGRDDESREEYFKMSIAIVDGVLLASHEVIKAITNILTYNTNRIISAVDKKEYIIKQ